MNFRKFSILILFSFFNLAWDWETFSLRKEEKTSPLKLQAVWTVDVVQEGALRPSLNHRSPPLVTEDLVVQGNLINGVKAYNKQNGKLLWDVEIKPGVASPLVLHKGSLYFGGADGFFYSLKLKDGRLNWKFFTGSENSSPPLIYEDKVYWTSNNQKIYAFSLEGKRLWMYSGSTPSKAFIVRGRPRPAAYKNLVYAAFYPSFLVALDKTTGTVRWKKELSSSHTVIEDLKKIENCLLVPVFDFYLFCIKLLNGKVIWKVRGGSSSSLVRQSRKGKSTSVFNRTNVIYQSYKDTLYALDVKGGRSFWQKHIKGVMFAVPPSLIKHYLVYGFPSRGELIFASADNGNTLTKYKFGKGLSVPVSVDKNNKDIYFLSVDGYLHKVSVL